MTCPNNLPDHHYILEDANGPTSLGICKYCGAEKVCKNSGEMVDFKSGTKVMRGKALREDAGDFYPNGDAGWTR